jgi:hypothetical protein
MYLCHLQCSDIMNSILVLQQCTVKLVLSDQARETQKKVLSIRWSFKHEQELSVRQRARLFYCLPIKKVFAVKGNTRISVFLK